MKSYYTAIDMDWNGAFVNWITNGIEHPEMGRNIFYGVLIRTGLLVTEIKILF